MEFLSYSIMENSTHDKSLMNEIMRFKLSNKDTFKLYLLEKLDELKANSSKSKYEFLDENSNTLLHYSLQVEKEDLIESILEIYEESGDICEFKKWLKRKNQKMHTPIEIACQRGLRFSIMKIYSYYKKYEIQFDFVQNSNNIFHYLSKIDDAFLIVFFYERLIIDYQFTRDKITHVINLRNHLGVIPLHNACSFINHNSLDVLLDLNSDLNATDNEGNTPLHYSVFGSDSNIVKRLLIRGADKRIKNKKGQTCLDVAIILQKADLIEALNSFSLFEKIFLFKEELTKIKNKRHDIKLGISLCLIAALKIYFSVIVIQVTMNKKLDAVKVLKCFFNNCTFDTMMVIILTGFDLLIIIFFLSIILCYSKKSYLEKGKPEESLSELFQNSDFACMKCRIIVNENTTHCLICDRCVENFHHHCYWLNVCITMKTLTLFKTTVISFLIFFILNLAYLVIIEYKFFAGDYNKFLIITYKNDNLSKIVLITISLILIIVMLTGIYLVVG